MPGSASRPQPFTPSALWGQTTLGHPAIGPDGEHAAYVRTTIEGGAYRERIWKLSLGGGEPVCIAQLGRRCTRPRYSPDGELLLFLSDHDGPLSTYVMAAAGGEPRRIGQFPGPVLHAEWLADARRVAVLAPAGVERFAVGDPADPTARRIRDLTWRRDGVGIRDQFTSLWLLDIETGASRLVTDPSYEVSGAFPCPDGSIAILADLTPSAGVEEFAQLHRIDPHTGGASALVSLPGEVIAAAWSTGGRLAVIGKDTLESPGWRNTGLYVLDGSELRELGAALDRPIGTTPWWNDLAATTAPARSLFWTDESHVVTHVADAGRRTLCRFGLDGSVEALTGPDLMCGPAVGAGERIVAIATELATAPELCLLEGGRARPLTTSGAAWPGPFTRSSVPHEVGSRDGHVIATWHLRGRGVEGPGPCVLEIHGGAPGAMGSPVPAALHLALADAGISVIWAEPRGSAGFGQAYCPDDASSWEPAFDDLVDVVHWAIGVGLAEPGRIGVTGGSYGGFMTTWLLGCEPDLFAAGVIEIPLTDMTAGFLSADMYCHADLAFPRDWLRMLDLSPYRWIANTKAATLIIAGDEDLRTPPFQADLVFDILRRAGKTVEMIRYPGESHSFRVSGRPDRRVDRLERIVDWFSGYLTREVDGGTVRAAGDAARATP